MCQRFIVGHGSLDDGYDISVSVSVRKDIVLLEELGTKGLKAKHCRIQLIQLIQSRTVETVLSFN